MNNRYPAKRAVAGPAVKKVNFSYARNVGRRRPAPGAIAAYLKNRTRREKARNAARQRRASKAYERAKKIISAPNYVATWPNNNVNKLKKAIATVSHPNYVATWPNNNAGAHKKKRNNNNTTKKPVSQFVRNRLKTNWGVIVPTNKFIPEPLFWDQYSLGTNKKGRRCDSGHVVNPWTGRCTKPKYIKSAWRVR